MDNGHAVVAREGHRADVVITRPEKRNAMDRAVIADLTQAFRGLADADGVRAVALLGRGPVFCAGMDLEMMHESSQDEHSAIHADLTDLFDAIESVPAPVVVGIKRAAVAGAFELTLPADFRVIGSEADYGVIEVKLGIFPHGGSTQRLPRLVGLARARELVLTGELIDPAEAERIDLVTEVVDPAEAPGDDDPPVAGTDHPVDRRARAFADDLTGNAPLGMARAKAALEGAFDRPLGEGLEYEGELAMDLYATEDREEGFAARIEGREPEFEGQ